MGEEKYLNYLKLGKVCAAVSPLRGRKWQFLLGLFYMNIVKKGKEIFILLIGALASQDSLCANVYCPNAAYSFSPLWICWNRRQWVKWFYGGIQWSAKQNPVNSVELTPR